MPHSVSRMATAGYFRRAPHGGLGTTEAGTTTYQSVNDLARALCRAAAAQGPD